MSCPSCGLRMYSAGILLIRDECPRCGVELTRERAPKRAPVSLADLRRASAKGERPPEAPPPD
ncbi:MAG TPA: hypothetical protein VF752_10570 [Thermoleophilaceae bacterium]